MAQKANEPNEKDLEKVRAKLSALNLKLKKFSTHRRRSSKSSIVRFKRTPDYELNDASLEEVRDKLRHVNDFLLKRFMGGEKLIPAKTIVKEAVASQIEDDGAADQDIEEKEETTIGLPTIDEDEDKNDITDVAEKLGVGLDLGTAYLVASREIKNIQVFVRNERNSFLSVRSDLATQELLAKLKIKYATMGDNLYVLGNLSLDLATLFNRETQRSMKMGILNPTESESIPIIKLIIQNILWPPRAEKEVCCFSLPADPIDQQQDTIYHQGVFEGILKSLGFEPAIVDEGYAVVLAELGYSDFTGIGVSCGGGSVNVCSSYKSVSSMSFSIARGGDWVDASAAAVLGVPASKVTTIKEQGMKLKSPVSREEEAIAIYFRNFVRYFLENMALGFKVGQKAPCFKEPVDIVFAGGSALIGDFIDVVKEEAQSVDLGISLRELKLADEPFTSVTRGCLFNAINIDKHNKT